MKKNASALVAPLAPLALLALLAWPPLASGVETKSAKRNAKAVAEPVTCVVGEFRTAALTTHDPQLRAKNALIWIQTHAPHCSADQLLALANGRSPWLGTADTAEIASALEVILEKVAIRHPAPPSGKPPETPAGEKPPAPVSAKPKTPETPVPETPATAPVAETATTAGAAPPPTAPTTPAVAVGPVIAPVQVAPPPTAGPGPAPTKPAPTSAAATASPPATAPASAPAAAR